MKLVYAPGARLQLQAIFSYLQERSPQAALKVLSQIRRTAERLKTNPRLGRVTNLPGLFVLIETRYRYRLFYRINDEAIEIIRILHRAQQK